MSAIMEWAGEYILAFVALLLLAAPVVHYLLTGWTTRRKQILAGFGESGIQYYFRLFFPAEADDSADPSVALERFYDRQFGRQHYILPGAVLLGVAVSMVGFASWACFSWLRPPADSSFKIPAIVVAGIAGAYAWVVWDFIRRAHLRDLHPTNLFRASYRLLIAAPLAIGIAGVLKDELGVPLAVLLGSFPTHTLLKFARRLASARIGVQSDSASKYPLEKLQGVGLREAERFEEEGVSTIVQLAYADPVALTIQTSFAFSYVVDCCSQALAWLYFEDDLVTMRQSGLRGAQEFSTLIDEIDSKDTKTKQRAAKCLKTVAAKLNADADTFEWTLRGVAEDPYTQFLCRVWCMEFTPRTQEDAEQPKDGQ